MFCVYDTDGNIIAFHHKKRVVEKYIDRIYSLHKINLKIGKLKESSKYKLIGKDDLYLIRYADTYIQSGYLSYVEISSDQFIEDDQQALDTLYRMLELSRLKKKEVKTITKAIEVIEKIVKEDREYTPTIKDLKTMKHNYDAYVYNTGIL